MSNILKRAFTYAKENSVGQLARKGIEHELRKFSENGYETWLRAQAPTSEEYLMQRRTEKTVTFSVLVPIYRTPEGYLREMIESVLQQSYPYLELILADGSCGDDSARKVIEEYTKRDDRVIYFELSANEGISGNTNAALRAASGDYICLLDHDDLLTTDALYYYAKEIGENPSVSMIYSDEDKVTMDGAKHFTPHFKPDFNLALLRSNNYICHFFCVKREIALKCRGFHSKYDGAQDYDFILRCAELALRLRQNADIAGTVSGMVPCNEWSDVIVHVPRILYHWRSHPASTAADPGSKMYAYEAGRKAILAHLRRCGLRGTVRMTDNPGYYRTRLHVDESAREDFAVISHRGVTPAHEGWYKELRSFAAMKDTAFVTGRVYDKHHVYIRGFEVLGMYGHLCDTPFHGIRAGFHDYMHRAVTAQDTACVPGEWMMVRKTVLEEVLTKAAEVLGEESMTLEEFKMRPGWNAELALIARKLGYRNVYTPFAVATISGEPYREEDLEEYLSSEDPLKEYLQSELCKNDGYYNHNLSLENGHYILKEI